jgi:uncharacterized membrane protein YeaQ/YmgE (transglycosylase-associated protein family)
MAFAINGSTINLDLDTILIWLLIGLVAGFLAPVFHVNVEIVGHSIISEMIVAFAGAVILLLIVRMFGGAGTRRRASWT